MTDPTRACRICGPGTPYADLYGHAAGFIPVPADGVICWKPCPNCRPEQHAAWWGGYLRDTRRRLELIEQGKAGELA